MAGSGFRVYRQRAVGASTVEKKRTAATTQYRSGDLCKMSAGVLTKIGATDKAEYLFQHIKTPKGVLEQATKDKSTAAQEEALAIDVMGGDNILYSELTGDAQPPLFNKATNTNTTATEVVMTEAGSNDDYTGGTVFCRELGEQRQIADDVQSGGTKTLTVAPAFSRAVTAGDHIDALPLGEGTRNAKYNATSPHQCVGVAVGDNSGGTLKVEEVHLEQTPQFILTSCPDNE